MKITNDISQIGVNDRKIDLFEGQFKVQNGMAYNSYCIMDEKIAILDTVEAKFLNEWFDNMDTVLAGRTPDYLIVSHMEPDHSANIGAFTQRYPSATVVATAAALNMMNGYFGTDYADRRIVATDGATLSLGKHTLSFFTAPLVHWPEVMVTYDATDRVLFSADAFGKFGTSDAGEEWAPEARRYYFGIVGKFGAQAQAVLKKAAALDIAVICPLHGPVLSENLDYYIGLYWQWSSYLPENEGVMIAYTSVYGNTKKAVDLLADKLKASGCPEVVLHDLTRTDFSMAIADAFRMSKLVLATTTYNTSIFPAMHSFIHALTERNFRDRTIGLIENGSWAPMAAKNMRAMLEDCKNITLTETTVTLKGGFSEETKKATGTLADELCRGYDAPAVKTDSSALFRIGYGLYVVTVNDGKKDNGLIVNTVTQLTSTPNRVAVTIHKANYSHHVIQKTGKMNVNCLSVEAPFSVFETFGFQSGRNVDKFADCTPNRSANGLVVLPRHINSYLSLQVVQYLDMGTHGMFVCDVTEAAVLSEAESMTYAYYHANVKPKPKTEAKKGFVCKICGYIYEGDSLPDDFVCPLCKHGAADFEPLS